MQSSSSEAGARKSPSFSCSAPDCGKFFLRKEHLNRHARTHGSFRPHKCFICYRSFARSDILNRHVLQHNAPPEGPKRTLLACQTCRKRKTKCDSNDPCSTCAATQRPCIRQPSSMQANLKRNQIDRRSLTPSESGSEEESLRQDGSNGRRKRYKGDVSSTVASRRPSRDGSRAASPLSGDLDEAITSRGLARFASEELDAQDAALTSPSTQDFIALSSRPLDADSTNVPTSFSFSPTECFHEDPLGPSFMTELQADQSLFAADYSIENNESRPYSSCDDNGIPFGPLVGSNLLSNSSHHYRFSVDSGIGEEGLLQVGNQMGCGQNLATTGTSISLAPFHQAWSILPLPTYLSRQPSKLLSDALASFSIPPQTTTSQHLFSPSIDGELIKSFMPGSTEDFASRDSISNVSLQTLQALVITLIYALLSDMPPETTGWAVRWADIAISTFRQLGVFANRWLPQTTKPTGEKHWVLEEQAKRLVYALLKIDAYLSLILCRPPSIRLQEIRISLPVSEDLWNAATSEDEKRLQWYEPAGRAKTAFSSIVRDIIQSGGWMTAYSKMPPLSLEDSHLGLCSLQTEIWTAAQETHYYNHGSSGGEERKMPRQVKVCRRLLEDWPEYMEKCHRLEQKLYVDPPDPESPYLARVLTLYHLSALNLYANVPVLETKKCCAQCQDADLDNMIMAWAQSSDGRRAVYHAAQLQRVHEREHAISTPEQLQFSNPLRSAGLLASAITLCHYSVIFSRSRDATDVVSSARLNDSPPNAAWQAVELSDTMGTGEEHTSETWIKCGGLASVSDIPLCVFSVPKLSSWYRERLGAVPSYSQRLISFLLTLKV